MSEQLNGTSQSAESALASLKSLSPQLNSPDDVWRFVDLQSECLGRNGFAPSTDSRRWFWGNQASGSGGHGIWEHMVENTELGEYLVVGTGRASRQVSVVSASP